MTASEQTQLFGMPDATHLSPRPDGQHHSWWWKMLDGYTMSIEWLDDPIESECGRYRVMIDDRFICDRPTFEGAFEEVRFYIASHRSSYGGAFE